MEGTLTAPPVGGVEAEDAAERSVSGTDANGSGVEREPPHGGGRGGRGAGRGGRGGRGAATRPAASWSDDDVSELFRLRYAELVDNFKNTKDTKRIKYAWAVLASTLSVNQSKVSTDQQCQSKWASAREAEGRTGTTRRPNRYSSMKYYWGDATGMNNRPHLSTEDPDTISPQKSAPS
ncbi:Hypothetical protein PHPALM_807 [Phytophthora palmivora]|uniref:Uncharacterized protein n=1 Tax=Phytophthora palmivora TaxID=4796 RepID=A0A2P4YTY3_9STRA|nr:Hypothetical protein PHPALM_807 [Phytophthora palmivora]